VKAAQTSIPVTHEATLQHLLDQPAIRIVFDLGRMRFEIIYEREELDAVVLVGCKLSLNPRAYGGKVAISLNRSIPCERDERKL
jgi:hypothetical protein